MAALRVANMTFSDLRPWVHCSVVTFPFLKVSISIGPFPSLFFFFYWRGAPIPFPWRAAATRFTCHKTSREYFQHTLATTSSSQAMSLRVQIAAAAAAAGDAAKPRFPPPPSLQGSKQCIKTRKRGERSGNWRKRDARGRRRRRKRKLVGNKKVITIAKLDSVLGAVLPPLLASQFRASLEIWQKGKT